MSLGGICISKKLSIKEVIIINDDIEELFGEVTQKPQIDIDDLIEMTEDEVFLVATMVINHIFLESICMKVAAYINNQKNFDFDGISDRGERVRKLELYVYEKHLEVYMSKIPARIGMYSFNEKLKKGSLVTLAHMIVIYLCLQVYPKNQILPKTF